jgi:hypothetical protein
MRPEAQAERIESRNRGSRMIRRVTLAAGTVAVGVTGVLAAVTASATRTTHAVAGRVSTVTRTASAIPVVPEPTATVASGAAAAPAASPSAPQSAPSPTSAPPVAVSGGS